MRDEIVAKVCSNCETFKNIGYRCPYIRNLTTAFHSIKDMAYEHKDIFETVSIHIACVGFCESHKKHVL